MIIHVVKNVQKPGANGPPLSLHPDIHTLGLVEFSLSASPPYVFNHLLFGILESSLAQQSLKPHPSAGAFPSHKFMMRRVKYPIMGSHQLWAPMKKQICNYAGIAIFRIPVEL